MNALLNFDHAPLVPPACPKPSRFALPQFDQTEMSTPPTTPRKPGRSGVGSLPPLPSTPARKSAPPLLQALQANSVDMVSDVIAGDADAASLPFWDHNVEPPLCCATRLSCDAPIVSYLLEARADVNATNVDGITALDIVRRPARLRGDDVELSDAIFAFTSTVPPKKNKDEIERLLLAAGACTSQAHAREETLQLPQLFHCTDMPLLGDDDIGRQFDAKASYPMVAPCQLDVAEMTAMLGSLFPFQEENDN